MLLDVQIGIRHPFSSRHPKEQRLLSGWDDRCLVAQIDAWWSGLSTWRCSTSFVGGIQPTSWPLWLNMFVCSMLFLIVFDDRLQRRHRSIQLFLGHLPLNSKDWKGHRYTKQIPLSFQDISCMMPTNVVCLLSSIQWCFHTLTQYETYLCWCISPDPVAQQQRSRGGISTTPKNDPEISCGILW